MSKYEAHRKACDLWHRKVGQGPWTAGDRVGMTCARRKNVEDRFEVGYTELRSANPEVWITTVMGRGPSWEIAFQRAGVDQ